MKAQRVEHAAAERGRPPSSAGHDLTLDLVRGYVSCAWKVKRKFRKIRGRSMKKLLAIIGGACLGLVLILVAVIVLVVAPKGRALDRESKAFADSAIVAIAANWNESELVDRASEQFIMSFKSRDDMYHVLDPLRQLGQLVKYDGSVGDSNMNLQLGHGIVVTAVYQAHAIFRNGEARIRISLIKSDDQWEILGFFVTPSFTKPLTSVPPVA